MNPGMIDMVRGYIDERPYLNQVKFAKKADISEKTFGRFLSGKLVSFATARNILLVTYESNYLEVYKILKEFYPEELWLDSAIQGLEENELDSPPDPVIDELISRSVHTQDLVHLLTREIGVSKLLINRLFSDKGIADVESLIEDGKVIELGNGFVRLKNYKISFLPATGKSVSINTVIKYDRSNFGLPDSLLSAQLGFTSFEGLRKMKEIMVKAVKDCIIVKKAHPGWIPYLQSTVMVKVFEDLETYAEDKANPLKAKNSHKEMI